MAVVASVEMQAETLARLKADIAAGLKEADEGRCVDGETALRALHAKHFPGRG